MPESRKIAETMDDENELLCRKLRLEACKKSVIATRRLRSAKRGGPEQNKSFYKLKAGELEDVNTAHDVLREYAKLVSGRVDRILRERLSREIRDMIYDHILPHGEIVVGRMHCGAIALREQVSNEWVNIRQYQFLGDDIVSELAVCLYRTRTFTLDKSSEANMSTDSDIMTDFLAADVYSTKISPAKFISRVFVSIGPYCFRPLEEYERAASSAFRLFRDATEHRGMNSRSQLLASLGALKVLQHPHCALTVDLKATLDLEDIQFSTPVALRKVCSHLGGLISSGWKIQMSLVDYCPYQPYERGFGIAPRRLVEMYPSVTIPLPPEKGNFVVLTEKDAYTTVRTTEEMVELLEAANIHPITASRECAYWKLWLQSLRPKEEIDQDGGLDTRNDVPAWEIVKARLEDAMLQVWQP
ncbi:hypothetical protein A1F97_07142 [Pyrenophora tritici-repentis]|nr:AraJ, Arabinose efflux permease [Pyrenophora tritici-repentis]PZD37961.1 hypothetical protein A1F97_07142 [Pyrenophora tritici-repentis]